MRTLVLIGGLLIAEALIAFATVKLSRRPQRRYVGFLITEPETGLVIAGKDLVMNLKSTQAVTALAQFKNRLRGPATIQAGSAVLEVVAPTGAFTAVQDPNNELAIRITANPQAEGNDSDVGIVRLIVDGDAGEGVKPLVAELAVNITPGDAEIAELIAGPVEEQ